LHHSDISDCVLKWHNEHPTVPNCLNKFTPNGRYLGLLEPINLLVQSVQ